MTWAPCEQSDCRSKRQPFITPLPSGSRPRSGRGVRLIVKSVVSAAHLRRLLTDVCLGSWFEFLAHSLETGAIAPTRPKVPTPEGCLPLCGNARLHARFLATSREPSALGIHVKVSQNSHRRWKPAACHWPVRQASRPTPNDPRALL